MAHKPAKSKPKLRDFSRTPLTPEELAALSKALSESVHPIVAGILGSILVEHELEVLLRQRFRRKDDATWALLLSDNGPLSSFYAKIVMGHAFGFYNENTYDDLHIVRNIRNAFAHSKKLIDFDNELVLAELKKAKNLKRRDLRTLANPTTATDARYAYIGLCYRLGTRLADVQIRSLRAKGRRLRKKLGRAATPFADALRPFLQLPQATSKLNPLSFPAGQTGDPTPEAPKGLLSGLFDPPAKSDDSKDK
jgi:hypothetical protein